MAFPRPILFLLLAAGVAGLSAFADDTAALQARIDAAAAAGGGTVVVSGTPVVAGLRLKSNVTLELSAGARLVAATNTKVAAVWANGATNVAIRGAGTIDGNGAALDRVISRAPRLKLRPGWGTVQFRNCRGVRIEGVRLLGASGWTCHLRQCEDVTVRGMRIFAHANFNNDGLDIESSDVLVEDCDIDSEDDAIVFKTCTVETCVTNVVVRNCRLSTNSSYIKFGTESKGRVKDVLVENCTLECRTPIRVREDHRRMPGVTGTDTGISGIEVAVVDGGTLEDVTVRGITMGAGVITPVFVRMGARRPPAREGTSYLRNVLIEDVRMTAPSRSFVASSVTGVPGRRPAGIVLRNLDLWFKGGLSPEDAVWPREGFRNYPSPWGTFFSALPAYAFFVRHADGVRFENVRTRFDDPSERRPAVVAMDAEVEKTGCAFAEPDVPAKREFRISDYGAKADGTKCTAAFAKAIAACTPGGRVTVPKGEWFTGSIRLKDDMELHLEDGAVVRFSDDPKDCLPAVMSTFEGQEAMNYSPLVYAFGCTNVAVTGSGTFVTDQTKWRAMQLMHQHAPEWRAHYDEFNAWSRGNARPPEARDLTQWGEPWVFRPHFLQFNRCRNVRLEGFRVRYSPFWLVELLCCEDVVCRGLDLFGMFGNSDGIDIESSKRVLVESCTLDQADDAFCVKSGRDEEGRRRGIPTEDVEIRYCHVKHSGGFLTIGSEISGGARNIRIHDCTADVVRNVFVLRSYASRGGHVEDVTMENCAIDRCEQWFFATRLGWPVDPAKVSADRVRWTTYDGITARNVFVGDCGSSYNIIGAPEAKYRGIRLEGCEIGHLRRPETNALVNVEASVDVSGLRFKDLPKPERRHINADELVLRPDFDYATIAELYGRDLILDYRKGKGPGERLRWERLHNLRRTGWELNIHD